MSTISPGRAAIAASFPPFDLAAALKGAQYIHIYDLPNVKPYRDVRRIDGEHAATLVWAGEWLIFPDDEAGRMQEQLRMLPSKGSR